MNAYKQELEREISATNHKVDELMEELQNSNGTSHPNFISVWSEILSLRQTLHAKQQRLAGTGKNHRNLPEFVNLDQFKRK